MNSNTLLAFAANVGGDASAIDFMLRTQPTENAKAAAEQIGTNFVQFCHESFDEVADLTTSSKSILDYDGSSAGIFASMVMSSYQDWMRFSPEKRDRIAYKTRGVDFEELMRRDLMRVFANAEWVYSKQVFEFSDELLYSLVSEFAPIKLPKDDEIATGKEDYLETKKIFGAKNFQLIQTKLFVDRINTLPFKTFVLDVSGNRMFKGCGIAAIQITPLFKPNNCKLIVYAEIILENGDIHGVYEYNVDYKDRQYAVIEEDGSKYITVVLVNSKESADILSGKSDARPFEPSLKDPKDPYNTICGAVVLQVINYLGSDFADIEESSATKNTYKPPTDSSRIKNTYKELQGWSCGFRYAAAVKQQNARKEYAVSEGTGTPKRPHMRKAHWHHYWAGSGDDRHLIRRWLTAIAVKMDFDSELPIVIHKRG